jgi:hypothetical protein
MALENDGLIHCDGAKDCKNVVKNNRWARTKSGWFETKSGEFFCPEHIPAWVEEWRRRKKGET